ncbi:MULTISPECIES: hypothetical protein [unclassified Bradyrhizobium]
MHHVIRGRIALCGSPGLFKPDLACSQRRPAHASRWAFWSIRGIFIAIQLGMATIVRAARAVDGHVGHPAALQ